VNEGREIVSIAWYSHRPDWHELLYADGGYERVLGGLETAEALAMALKLERMPHGLGMVQWERPAKSERSPYGQHDPW